MFPVAYARLLLEKVLEAALVAIGEPGLIARLGDAVGYIRLAPTGLRPSVVVRSYDSHFCSRFLFAGSDLTSNSSGSPT